MKRQLKLKYMKALLEHVSYYNKMAPFPVYDTDYENKIKETIKGMEDLEKDYDSEPVTACKYCKSLHVLVDEYDNNICGRCGSINEIIEFENIYKYKEFINAKRT